jgi:hypothetical protein
MTAELIYRIPEWLLLLLAASLFLATAAVGERRGRARRDAVGDPARSHIGVLQGAVLGLLGLLLAFSFSMAVGRYETRRNLVLAEANAIGTTWLRAGLLSAPHDVTVRALLRRYVDGRQAQLTGESLAEAIREAEAIHAALWTHADAIARSEPRQGVVSLFVTALNELIDLHASRLAAFRNHVPETVYYVLYAVAAVAMGLAGYAAGLAGHQRLAPTMCLAILFAVLITLITDLDRPWRGLIQVSQQPMIDLRQSMGP